MSLLTRRTQFFSRLGNTARWRSAILAVGLLSVVPNELRPEALPAMGGRPGVSQRTEVAGNTAGGEDMTPSVVEADYPDNLVDESLPGNFAEQTEDDLTLFGDWLENIVGTEGNCYRNDSLHVLGSNRSPSQLLAMDAIPVEVAQRFPKPTRRDTIEVFHEKTWKELSQFLKTSSDISFCINGGSSAAGGGLTHTQQLLGRRLPEYMRKTGSIRPDANVTVHERAHGKRDTMHSTVLQHSYIPPNTDIVIWEFAINDHRMSLDPEKRILEERNVLLMWLDQMAQLQPRPPYVILVYLWATPFTILDTNGTRAVHNPVFESHGRLAAQYDFVVGHFNMASYINEMDIAQQRARCAFLADLHHPNSLGHALMAHFVLDVMTADPVASSRLLDRTNTKRVPLQWGCGTETEDKRLLHSRILPHALANMTDANDDMSHEQPPAARVGPLASFTTEIPNNADIHVGMMSMLQEVPKKQHGKSSLFRGDRQLSSNLPCCRSCPGNKTTGTMERDPTLDFVISPETYSNSSSGLARRMENGIGAIQLGLVRYMGPVRVYLDNPEDDAATTAEPAPGRLVGVYKWPCLWANKGVYIDLHWFVPDEPKTAKRVGLCSLDGCCCNKGAKTNSCSQLLSLALY